MYNATLHIVINIKLRASVEILLYTDVTIENIKMFLVLVPRFLNEIYFV